MKSYSSLGLTFVSTAALARTARIMIISIITSKLFAVENSWTIPITHMMIKTAGRRYLITKVHVLPTLIVECSFNTGRKCSTP